MSWYPSKRRSRTFPILLPTSGEWSFGFVSFFGGVRGTLGRLSRLFGGGLALVTSLAAGLDALQDGLAVLVELQLGDDDVGGVDAQRDGLAGDLLAGDTLDVDHVLETVHGGDLALLVLVGAADDLDLVILADGDAADLFGRARSARVVAERSVESKLQTYVVLLTELLAERGAHDVATNAGGGLEVRLARLAAGGVEGCTRRTIISFAVVPMGSASYCCMLLQTYWS